MRIFGERHPVLALMLVPVFLSALGPAGAQTGNELILPEGTTLNLQLNDTLSTKQNKEGDTFTAMVIAPVYLKDRLVIPKGCIVSGSVSHVMGPGRFKGKAQINLMFNTIRLPDSARPLPIVASLARIGSDANAGTDGEGTITPAGSKGKDAAKVGAPAATGAIIGLIIDRGHGAAIGAGIGAAVGVATIFAGHGADVEVKRGSSMDIVLDRPLTIPSETVKRDGASIER